MWGLCACAIERRPVDPCQPTLTARRTAPPTWGEGSPRHDTNPLWCARRIGMSLKLVREQLTLIYGMRLFAGRAPDGGPHARVTFRGPDGTEQELPLHTISGTRDEIRAQLLQSVDAFFDLVDADE